MARRRTPSPTAAELRILQVLWRLGSGTVREVSELLPKGTAYTTILKQLQIMLEKGLVRRNESRRPHVYAPASAAEQTRSQVLRSVIDAAFAGSAADLVLHALRRHAISAADLEQIRALLEDQDEEGGDDDGGNDRDEHGS